MAKIRFPVVGTWIETRHGVEPRKCFFTANLDQDSVATCQRWGERAMNDGEGISYSVREYHPDTGAQRILGIGDFRGYTTYRR